MVARVDVSMCPLNVWAPNITVFPERDPWDARGVGAVFPIRARNAKRVPGGPWWGPVAAPPLALTWHVDHAAVAILHDVAGLTVNPTGGDTVNRKEVESHL